MKISNALNILYLLYLWKNFFIKIYLRSDLKVEKERKILLINQIEYNISPLQYTEHPHTPTTIGIIGGNLIEKNSLYFFLILHSIPFCGYSNNTKKNEFKIFPNNFSQSQTSHPSNLHHTHLPIVILQNMNINFISIKFLFQQGILKYGINKKIKFSFCHSEKV